MAARGNFKPQHLVVVVVNRISLSANLKIRAVLMVEIEKYIKKEGITQAVAAKRFGVTQPRISDLIRGKMDLFTVDMLINMLASAGVSVDIHIHKKRAA